MNGAQLAAWESTLLPRQADLERLYDEALTRLGHLATISTRHMVATTVVDAIVDGWASADFVRLDAGPTASASDAVDESYDAARANAANAIY